MHEDFLKKISHRILEMKSFNRETVFTISTTAKQETKPYLTPLRITPSFVLSGCVIFNQNQNLDLLQQIDGEIDVVLADSEKKFPFFDVEATGRLNKNNGSVGGKTVSSMCHEYMVKSEVYDFKPNDLTVNAAWSFLSQRIGTINNASVVIIGAGNIGSKLALKLVECGADVKINRRNYEKASLIVRGLNLVKPENADSQISICSDVFADTPYANVLIGASNGLPVINQKMVKKLKSDCVILDLGKNTLTRGAIDQAMRTSMSLYRTDVTPALEAFVYELLKTRSILTYSCGKKNMGFFNIVGGGFFGGKGDVVVDCIHNPTRVLGVSQGDGVMKQVLNTSDKANIEWLKKSLKIGASFWDKKEHGVN